MAAPREVEGQSASAGIACGPAHIAVDQAQQFPPHRSVAIERQNLTRAVQVAAAELEALISRSDADSAEILDFQIEMLLDEEILELAFARIGTGDSAALAWAGGLDAYIADIEMSEDRVFSARAADVLDIRTRVLAVLSGRPVADFPDGSIFIAKDIAPSLFLAHDWSRGGGIALTGGSTVSHVALLARAKAVPMVVGLDELSAEPGEMILVDGTRGRAVVNPPDGAGPTEHTPKSQPADELPEATINGRLHTADGVPIGLWLNVNGATDFERLDPDAVDGVGLMRTEFLIATPADAIDEERQYDWYRRALVWAGHHPVTIRMFDLGGDKAIPGLGGAEDTSFLGVRGIRLLLARPEIARAQARALIRAAIVGNLRVMLPMVTVPSELAAMSALFREEAALLARRGIAHALPPIGIMVEVPAAALTLDLFGDAAFFSFGTNDLQQYLAAAARDNPAVAPLHADAEQALFRLLKLAVEAAKAIGIPVSICGDMAGAPDFAARLLACGFRDFSMAPSRLNAVRSAVTMLASDGSPAGRQ
jgi:phosphoenolpyruvate-protein phosphotransferase (PTS system enzyme I)